MVRSLTRTAAAKVALALAIVLAALALVAAAGTGERAGASAVAGSSTDGVAKPKLRGKRAVLFVGNNWEGTADIIVASSGAWPGSTSSPTSRSG